MLHLELYGTESSIFAGVVFKARLFVRLNKSKTSGRVRLNPEHTKVSLDDANEDKATRNTKFWALDGSKFYQLKLEVKLKINFNFNFETRFGIP